VIIQLPTYINASLMALSKLKTYDVIFIKQMFRNHEHVLILHLKLFICKSNYEQSFLNRPKEISVFFNVT